jgi:hypothetical protein
MENWKMLTAQNISEYNRAELLGSFDSIRDEMVNGKECHTSDGTSVAAALLTIADEIRALTQAIQSMP